MLIIPVLLIYIELRCLTLEFLNVINILILVVGKIIKWKIKILKISSDIINSSWISLGIGLR